MTALEQRIHACAQALQNELSNYLVNSDADTERVWEAMRYSTLAGGKRIRPFLTLTVCELLGGNRETALAFASAVEMIHAYSLIHDDLPCMDNDEFRRGRPSCHIRFDEATAVLAGDALLTKAFEVIATAPASESARVRAVAVLAKEAGAAGMVGGQIMDMIAERIPTPPDKLVKLQEMKTGALLRAAAELGCLAAETTDRHTVDALVTYAGQIGLSFQIVDDILDVYGTDAIGKSMHSDEQNGKTTFLTVYGYDGAKERAVACTEAAKAAISRIPGAEILVEFADYLLKRAK